MSKAHTGLLAASFMIASTTAGLTAPYTFETVTVPNARVYSVTGINDVGQISGNSAVGTNYGNGFVSDIATGTVSSFAPNGFYTVAAGINNSGQAIGSTLMSGGTFGVVRDPVSGSYTKLPLGVPFPVGYSTTGINDAGQIVGFTPSGYHGSAADKGFLYDLVSNTFSYLVDPDTGTSNGYYAPPSSVGYTHPYDINNRGQIVGGTLTPITLMEVGFLLDLATDTYTAIDVPGSTATVATGINDLGQVVGNYTTGSQTAATESIFLLDLSTGLYTTITDPGTTSLGANGINNAGQIVGSFVTADGTQLGFIATPDANGTLVPEPTSIALLGGVIGALLWTRRSKNCAAPSPGDPAHHR